MVVQYFYGGAQPLWRCSTFMVVHNLYGGAVPLWWCSTFMAVQYIHEKMCSVLDKEDVTIVVYYVYCLALK